MRWMEVYESRIDWEIGVNGGYSNDYRNDSIILKEVQRCCI